jgi:hypothetical protein
MVDFTDNRLTSVMQLAEREMAAFLKATSSAAGLAGQASDCDMWLAGSAWLHALESIDCQDENQEKLFRRVTIQAISQLLADSQKTVRDQRQTPVGGISQLAVMQTAA